VDKIVRFTGIPIQNNPWPNDAPWQLSPDGDPYKATLWVDGNEEHVKLLNEAAACSTYLIEI
jgi:hypothetical protein